MASRRRSDQDAHDRYGRSGRGAPLSGAVSPGASQARRPSRCRSGHFDHRPGGHPGGPVKSWTGLLEQTRPLLGAPSFLLLTDLLTGWVCVPGRRTITAMIAVADPAGRRAHDAYHRFSRDGPWKMSGLWKVLAIHVVARHAPTGVIELLCDETPSPRPCVRRARRSRSALPVRLSVRSRGASGAVSSSSRGRSSRASVPVDVRVRTRPPPEVSRQLAGCFCSSCAVLDHASDPFSTSFTAMVGKPSQGAPPCTHH